MLKVTCDLPRVALVPISRPSTGFMKRRHCLAALLLAALLPLSEARAQNPSQEGEWGDELAIPIPGIHAVMVPPSGKVLLYSYYLNGSQGTDCWLYDPATDAVTQYLLDTNVFCGGHGHMPSGQLLLVGGVPGHFNTGHEKTFIWHEVTGFIQVGSMQKGRWYPTVTKLPDGSFVTMAGLDQGGLNNPLVETFDLPTRTWSVVPGADKLLPLYPMCFLIPTGEVLVAGPHRKTEALDLGTGQWRFIDTPIKAHHEGCAVLVPPHLDRVMMMGGHNLKESITFDRCEILDLSEANPQWRKTQDMHFRRQHHNAIVLPDATVLVIGGRFIGDEVSAESIQNPPKFRGNATRHAEVFDPVTETWTLLAEQTRPRLYHSTGILLRDGRVMTAGGEGEQSLEIFSPPYLFKGPRPSLGGQPSTTSYGATFTVQSDQADTIQSACLIAPGAVTHSYGQNQRYVPVDFQFTGGDSLDLTMPAQPVSAPPGYYMLWLVNDLGVPSVGEFIQIL